jgi:hypothetical protein
MSHFYARNENGEIELLKDVTTPAQARKAGKGYSSVTTKQAIMKGFVDIWGRKEAIRHTEENPRSGDWDFDEYVEWINKKVFRQYTRADGKVFWSSDFGTEGHAELEKWNLDQSYKFPSEWEMYCRRWPLWCADNNIKPLWAERLVICDKLKTAGSIDLVAMQMPEERYCLVDYKFRQGKEKYYDKDRDQLAIESRMIKEELGLDYLPPICSYQIDVTDGQHYPKWWTAKAQAKGITSFESINYAYNIANGIEEDREIYG